jgi:Lactate racemase N-terminal domain
MPRAVRKRSVTEAPALVRRVQPRSDSVVTIDRRSAPRLIPFGDDFLLHELPVGTRVIYPRPPLEPLPQPDVAIRQALLHPEGCDPLFAQLRPGMKVTIAIDDISLPLPQMRRPDIRERVLTIVLDLLADYGVDDVHIIIATSLHRRMTDAEIRGVVGATVFNSFAPDRLYNHDAEDRRNMVTVGKTEHGEKVTLNRRAAESDLLIYVNINLVPMDGGHKSVSVGLGSYDSIRHHHNHATMVDCQSYMDPTRSALHASCDRMGRLIDKQLKVFAIETTINTQMYPRTLDFLQRNEDTFTDLDRLKVDGMRWTLGRLSPSLRRDMLMRYAAPYGMTGVFAGRTEPVHSLALRRVYQQYAVPVRGQSDVLIVGVPYICPYNVNSIMNPILVQCTGLGYLFNMYRNKPLLRPGGTLIVCHPLPDEFHPDHHPSYIEFFHRCLAETTDSADLGTRFEAEFARDPNYIHQYRHGHAYHGVHPFYMWYWGDAGRAHVGRVIAAGAQDAGIATRMGWDAADTLDDAIAMARDDLGRSASITYLHLPPLVIADVED